MSRGVETDYVNQSEVQGQSFEIGAKVIYEGQEMIVSKAPDGDGDIKMKSLPDLSWVLAIAEALKVNKSLQSIK